MRASRLYKESLLDKLAAKIIERGNDLYDEETTEIFLWEHYLYETVEGKTTIITATHAEAFDGIRIPKEHRVWIREDEFVGVAHAAHRDVTDHELILAYTQLLQCFLSR